MSAFAYYSDTASNTLISLLGEAITIQSIDGEVSHDARAIYDDVYFSNFDGTTPVILDKPSFLIRDAVVAQVTDEYPLPRSKYTILRAEDGKSYRIVNYERDDKSTVRYIVEQIRVAS